jgi:hypothetical protein
MQAMIFLSLSFPHISHGNLEDPVTNQPTVCHFVTARAETQGLDRLGDRLKVKR